MCAKKVCSGECVSFCCYYNPLQVLVCLVVLCVHLSSEQCSSYKHTSEIYMEAVTALLHQKVEARYYIYLSSCNNVPTLLC